VPAVPACRVDESHLTGEPDDVAKDPRARASLLGGSKVLSGFGRMLVTSVGPNSQASREHPLSLLLMHSGVIQQHHSRQMQSRLNAALLCLATACCRCGKATCAGCCSLAGDSQHAARMFFVLCSRGPLLRWWLMAVPRASCALPLPQTGQQQQRGRREGQL
jgi:magnesium-transporting ATPase (P-type)